MTENNILRQFYLNYSPNRLKGFVCEPRKPEDFPNLNPAERILAVKLDEQRISNPNIPISLAGNDIVQTAIKAISGNNVPVKLMAAALAAVGGRELMRGIIGAVNAIDGDVMRSAGALSVLIADTKSGERFLFGDMPGNEFCSFYMTAAASSESPVARLNPIAVKTVQTVGSAEYWETPFKDTVGKSPQELADSLDGAFDRIFAVYCRYPQERMLSFASALQQALKPVGDEVLKAELLAIVAEYGWRTSHYIGTEF